NPKASASFSIAGGTFTPGSVFPVVVMENSGSNPVVIVEADLNYNQAEIEFQSIDYSNSAFGGKLASSGGSGNVQIYRYNTPVSGQVTVATVYFKALNTVKSTAITFAATSHIYSAQTATTPAGTDIWDGDT